MGSPMFDLFIRILEWEVSPCHPFLGDLSTNLPYERDEGINQQIETEDHVRGESRGLNRLKDTKRRVHASLSHSLTMVHQA